MSAESRMLLWRVVATRWLTNTGLRLACFLLWPFGRPSKVERVCIHRNGQIGDMVCALPAMQAIRNRFPNAQITLLSSAGEAGNPGIEGLASALPWLDRVLSYSAQSIAGMGGIKALRADLAQQKFDLWIALPQDLTNAQTEFRNLIFARWVGVRWAGGFFVNTVQRVLRQQAQCCQFERESTLLLDRVQSMGLGIPGTDGVFIIDEALEKNMQEKIRQAGLLDGRPILAIAPGGKRPQNRWPVERFSELARRWTDRGGVVLVIGGVSDAALAECIAANTNPSACVRFCGTTTLVESIALLRRCKVLAANDSGPMHLAAAVGIPCVVAFSARDFPVKWFPHGAGHSVIRKDVECSPCLTEQCTHDNICITQITVEEMWQALSLHFPTLSMA